MTPITDCINLFIHEDINECYDQNGGCQQECYNKRGSYECVCRKGYRRDTNDPTKCIDVNECLSANDCTQKCTNTPGSYKCDCFKGMAYVKGSNMCEDINECKVHNNGGCEQVCLNTNSSYRCRCSLGYRLAPDSKKCIKYQDVPTVSQLDRNAVNDYINTDVYRAI
ncbi:hypothetical protein QZH41_006876 [Actinostola sp. cb2023]|nr:hypothetical protein QZH41_006876 [Actinostola sp. cb2023]